MEVNMETPGSVDHDGSLLDYCRLHDITLQAWSPFQMPSWKGCFLGSDEYLELNQKIRVLAEKYGVSDTTIAAAWILRHPANMQLVTGTASEKRLKEKMCIRDRDEFHAAPPSSYRLEDLAPAQLPSNYPETLCIPRQGTLSSPNRVIILMKQLQDLSLIHIFLTNWKLKADSIFTKSGLDLIYSVVEVSTKDVHLVDECHTRYVVGISLTP